MVYLQIHEYRASSPRLIKRVSLNKIEKTIGTFRQVRQTASIPLRARACCSHCSPDSADWGPNSPSALRERHAQMPQPWAHMLFRWESARETALTWIHPRSVVHEWHPSTVKKHLKVVLKSLVMVLLMVFRACGKWIWAVFGVRRRLMQMHH